jgi:hypothetical protein
VVNAIALLYTSIFCCQHCLSLDSIPSSRRFLSVILIIVHSSKQTSFNFRLNEVSEVVHKLDDLCCDIQAVLADLDWSMGQKGLGDSEVR